jgi:hypothetical protein
MASLLDFLVSRATGVLRIRDDALFAVGRNEAAQDCTEDRRSAMRWIRGATSVADTLEICQKDAADAFAWTTYSESGHDHGEGLVLIDTDTFSAVASHSMNSVFTATYRNYQVVINITAMSTAADIGMRMRVAGADNSSALYRYSAFYNSAGATGISGSHTATNWLALYAVGGTMERAQAVIDLGDPAIAATTFMHGRAGVERTDSVGYTLHVGSSHDVATAYDGFTLFPGSGTMTGEVRVYGRRSDP